MTKKRSLWWFSFTLLLFSSCAKRMEHNISRLTKKDDASQKIAYAQTLYDMGEIEAAVAALRVFVDSNAYNPSHDGAYELIIEWLLQLKRYEEAKRLASYLMASHPNSPCVKKIIDLFSETTKPSDKETSDTILEDIPNEQPNEDISEQLVDPESSASKASNPHNREEYLVVDTKALGVLLPLTGPYAPFGKKALMAMSIAWHLPLNISGDRITLANKDGIKIVIADSKGDPHHARLMVENLIKAHHVALVIGEITNEPSMRAAQMCEQHGVPMLSLSRHPQVLGDNIFVFNPSPSQQISHLVDYVMDVKGYKRFAILYPRHNYGISMSTLFFDNVIKKGGKITALEAYDPHETTFTVPVKKLVGTHYITARPEYNELKPVIDFDALFIPEFNKLAMVIPALIREDILVSNNQKSMRAYALATKIEDPHFVELLGPSSWNDMGTINKIAGHIEGAYFIDSVNLLENDDFKSFADSLLKMTASKATTLDVFAHDVALFAIKILDHRETAPKENTRTHIRDLIAQFKGRIGLLENIAFTKKGELETKTIGFEIKSGKAHPVGLSH